MAFLLIHQNIVYRDAIGQDILGMYGILSRSQDCYVYGDHIVGRENCRALPRADLEAFLDDPANIIVYHHSDYWPEAEQLLRNTRARVVFKYHSPIPSKFFEGYSDYADKCRLGKEQIGRYLEDYPQVLWLGDSLFNLTELGIDGNRASFVVPPFVPLAYQGRIQPDAALLKSLVDDSRIHLLFTGRFVPNKGHRMLVSVLHEYVRRYGSNIVLNVIGKLDPKCQPYHDAVLNYAADLGVDTLLHYIGEVADPRLLAYYLGSDAYLCCSDHEGFCVPIAESQYAHLPVVAKARTAIPETVGAGGILLDEDPAPYAEAIHRIHMDRTCRQGLIVRGFANYARRFCQTAVETRFRFAIERWLGVTL